MTLRDLKLRISKQVSSTQDKRLDILNNKPFWIWDKEEHKKQYILSNGKCCFNHIVGCPVKDGKEFPLFDYE